MKPILHDATHLIARRGVRTPTGIDRVDTSYAAELTARSAIVAGLRYGWPNPSLVSPSRVAQLASRQLELWEWNSDPAGDPSFSGIRNFLLTGSQQGEMRTSRPRRVLDELRIVKEWLQARAAKDGRFDPPQGAIYLNLAQHGLENSAHLAWLDRRRDIKPVFLLHDVIPIDFPEFFRKGHARRFARLLRTIGRYAAALIVTCESTARRVSAALEREGLRNVPMHVSHLPVDARFSGAAANDHALAATPYVMMVGTLEPRKNYLLLLRLWKRFVASGTAAPKLLLVGGIGWKHHAILDLLRTSPELKGHVLQVSDLSDAAYRHFLAHARALLLPSVIEGYGLPLVEAASAGVPVIASDIDVFREILHGKGEFIAPSDDEAWARSVLTMNDPAALTRRREQTAGFTAPSWDRYMDGVRDFLDAL